MTRMENLNLTEVPHIESPDNRTMELPDEVGRDLDMTKLPDDTGESLNIDVLPDDSGESRPQVQMELSEPLSTQEIADKQDAEINAVKTGELPLDSDLKRGNFGEMVTDKTLRDLGYERISKDVVTNCTETGHHGIDGVYFRESGRPQYVILDAKYGSAQLGMTMDGKQMSKSWIDARLDQSIGKEAADKVRIELLLNPENVGLYICHVDKNGNATLDKLDFDANVTERNVDLHDA